MPLNTEVIHRGASLAGGEAVVRGLPPEPTFTVPAWSPYADVTPGSQDEWYRINKLCPQWPDGFWG